MISFSGRSIISTISSHRSQFHQFNHLGHLRFLEFSITNVPQSTCNELRELALNISQEQGNIVYEPIGSNIIFIGNQKKPSNPFKVLYNIVNSKAECQTDSCFRYKSCKFSSHNVAVAVHLKIFQTYISNVKRFPTKDFVVNVVDISRNPSTDQKKKQIQSKKERESKQKIRKSYQTC